MRQNYKSKELRLKSMLTLTPTKLPPSKNLEEDLIKYKDHLELIKSKRIELAQQYAETGNPSGLVTLDLTFMASKLNEGSFVDLAKTIDNSGELEPFFDLLPGYAAYRRVLMLMPKGQFYKEEKDRGKLREHQRTIGAKMMLTICLIDMELENQNKLNGYIKAMDSENFGQIFPNFD